MIMRDPNVQMTRTEILGEFTSNINEFASFVPPESEFARTGGTRSAIMHGGMFAYATDDLPLGVRSQSAFAAEEPEPAALEAYHFIKSYPGAVGPYQKSPASRIDEISGKIVYDTGRELLSEDRRIIGGFVLMSASKDLAPRSETYLTAFVAKKLGETLGFSIRDEHLQESAEGKSYEIVPGAVVNQMDEVKLQTYALQIMSGLFPPARRIHKAFGLRRRPK